MPQETLNSGTLVVPEEGASLLPPVPAPPVTPESNLEAQIAAVRAQLETLQENPPAAPGGEPSPAVSPSSGASIETPTPDSLTPVNPFASRQEELIAAKTAAMAPPEVQPPLNPFAVSHQESPLVISDGAPEATKAQQPVEIPSNLDEFLTDPESSFAKTLAEIRRLINSESAPDPNSKLEPDLKPEAEPDLVTVESQPESQLTPSVIATPDVITASENPTAPESTATVLEVPVPSPEEIAKIKQQQQLAKEQEEAQRKKEQEKIDPYADLVQGHQISNLSQIEEKPKIFETYINEKGEVAEREVKPEETSPPTVSNELPQAQTLPSTPTIAPEAEAAPVAAESNPPEPVAASPSPDSIPEPAAAEPNPAPPETPQPAEPLPTTGEPQDIPEPAPSTPVETDVSVDNLESLPVFSAEKPEDLPSIVIPGLETPASVNDEATGENLVSSETTTPVVEPAPTSESPATPEASPESQAPAPEAPTPTEALAPPESGPETTPTALEQPQPQPETAPPPKPPERPEPPPDSEQAVLQEIRQFYGHRSEVAMTNEKRLALLGQLYDLDAALQEKILAAQRNALLLERATGMTVEELGGMVA